MTLYHYTLSTGHGRESPRSEVRDEVIDKMRPMLAPGKHELPIDCYQLVVPVVEFGWWGTVHYSRRPLRPLRPIAAIMVAADEHESDYLWPYIERQYYQLTDLRGLRSADFFAAKKPDQLPWCVAWPIMARPDDAYWLGDLERCLAWAYLENRREGP